MSDGMSDSGGDGHLFSRGGKDRRPLMRNEIKAVPTVSTKKFVSKLEDIPNIECWVIASQTAIHVEGDERSRQAPGHGYPEHTDYYVTLYEVFTNEEEFKAELAHEVKDASLLYSGTKLRGFKLTPYTANGGGPRKSAVPMTWYSFILHDIIMPGAISAMVVFNDKGELLLGRTTKGMQRGQWVFPGGKIEEYETIQAAVQREFLEETGLVVNSGGQIETRELINPPDTHRIVIFNWGQAYPGSTPVAASDLSEVQWCTPRYAIGEPLTWFTREFLKANFQRIESLAQTLKK